MGEAEGKNDSRPQDTPRACAHVRYIQHRQAREGEIVRLVENGADRTQWSARDMVEAIYAQGAEEL